MERANNIQVCLLLIAFLVNESICGPNGNSQSIFSDIAAINIEYELWDDVVEVTNTTSNLTATNTTDVSNIPRSRSRRATRGIDRFHIWTDGIIPYTISEKFSLKERNKIIDAIRDMEAKTCIRYDDVSNLQEKPPARLVIKPDDPKGGCFSYVGRAGFAQVLNLGQSMANPGKTCVELGIIQHELMHALGFDHEHQRSDRDQFVKINREFLPAAVYFNFRRRRGSFDLGASYDPRSVMQYGNFDFTTVEGEPTIEWLADPTLPLGGRIMSKSDMAQINLMYDRACAARAKKNAPNVTTKPEMEKDFKLDVFKFCSMISMFPRFYCKFPFFAVNCENTCSGSFDPKDETIPTPAVENSSPTTTLTATRTTTTTSTITTRITPTTTTTTTPKPTTTTTLTPVTTTTTTISIPETTTTTKRTTPTTTTTTTQLTTKLTTILTTLPAKPTKRKKEECKNNRYECFFITRDSYYCRHFSRHCRKRCGVCN